MLSRLLTWGALCLLLLLPGLTAPSNADTGDEGLPLPRSLSGQAAINALGDDVGVAARLNRMSAGELTRILATDPTARLDRSGGMFYADTMAVQPGEPAAAAPYDYGQTFQLHSLPHADRVIFLDFDGATVSGTRWNSEDGLPARFYGGLNEDGATAFSNAEMDIVQAVWQRVAEDYAPFEVDVTTQDPGPAALQRTDHADESYGMRALITEDAVAPSVLCGGGCQGVAYIGVFNASWGGPGWSQPVFAFTSTFNNNPSMLADIITHEVGHTLALSHDGDVSGADYYGGQGIWQPVMGAGTRPMSQFSNGEYGGANNTQDDLGIITQFGAPLRMDDHGSTPAVATPITSSAAGVVTTRADVDWFSVEQGCPGPFSVQVSPAPTGPNLDIQLTVQTAAGASVVTDPAAGFDPATGLFGLDAAYSSSSLPEGTYKIGVAGVGHGDQNVDGYSDYGSLGAYTLEVDTSCTAPTVPGAPQSLVLLDATRSTISVGWTPPSDLGGLPVARYEVDRGTGSWVPVSASAPLEWTFTGLAAGTTYPVSVRAVNDTGTGPASTILPTKTDPPVKPTAPRIGTAGSGVAGGSVTAKAVWAAPLSNGGRAITAYRVIALRMSASGTVLKRFTKGVGSTVRRTSMILPAGRYRFQVVAINAVGTSPLSARSNLVTAR